jgi:hypothetical protein
MNNLPNSPPPAHPEKTLAAAMSPSQGQHNQISQQVGSAVARSGLQEAPSTMVDLFALQSSQPASSYLQQHLLAQQASQASAMPSSLHLQLLLQQQQQQQQENERAAATQLQMLLRRQQLTNLLASEQRGIAQGAHFQGQPQGQPHPYSALLGCIQPSTALGNTSIRQTNISNLLGQGSNNDAYSSLLRNEERRGPEEVKETGPNTGEPDSTANKQDVEEDRQDDDDDDKEEEEEETASEHTDEDDLINDTFPFKVYRMLMKAEEDDKESIVSFTPSSRAFRIHKPIDFATQVMPEYFTTSLMASFQRQLNLYGFRRITEGPDKGAYFHEHFRKGRISLCRNIKRKKTRVKARQGSFTSLPAATNPGATMTIRQLLADQAAQAASRHSILSGIDGGLGTAVAAPPFGTSGAFGAALGAFGGDWGVGVCWNLSSRPALMAALSTSLQQQQQADLIQQILLNQRQGQPEKADDNSSKFA